MRLKQRIAMTEPAICVTILADGADIAGSSIPADLSLEEMREILVRAIEGLNQTIAERDATASAAAETIEAVHDEDAGSAHTADGVDPDEA